MFKHFCAAVLLCMMITGCADLNAFMYHNEAQRNLARDLGKSYAICYLGCEYGFLEHSEVQRLETNIQIIAQNSPQTFTGLMQSTNKSARDEFQKMWGKCSKQPDCAKEATEHFEKFKSSLPQQVAGTEDLINRMQQRIVQSSLQQNAQPVINQPTQIQIPQVNVPTVSMQPMTGFNSNENSTRNYLINTDQGIQQERCRTLSDGSVYCY